VLTKGPQPILPVTQPGPNVQNQLPASESLPNRSRELIILSENLGSHPASLSWKGHAFSTRNPRITEASPSASPFFRGCKPLRRPLGSRTLECHSLAT
jgi:hypothetical protein